MSAMWARTAERLHGDDTPVPILAKGKTDTGRAWVYVRDDRPFGGADPPAVLFRASRDRSGDHPDEHLRGFTGILQADAYAGYNRLLASDRQPGPVVEAVCWAHARRKFFELADIAMSRRRGRNPAPRRSSQGDGITSIASEPSVNPHPVAVGRQVLCGIRQSMPSSR